MISSPITARGEVALRAGGYILETDHGPIFAGSLIGSAVSGVTLDHFNKFAVLGTFTNTGADGLDLRDVNALTIVGDIDAGQGALILTQNTVGGLTIKARLTSGASVNLNSGGTVRELNAGAIVTPLLNVTAVTGIELTGPNQINTVGTRHTNSGLNVINGVGP